MKRTRKQKPHSRFQNKFDIIIYYFDNKQFSKHVFTFFFKDVIACFLWIIFKNNYKENKKLYIKIISIETNKILVI